LGGAISITEYPKQKIHKNWFLLLFRFNDIKYVFTFRQLFDIMKNKNR